LSSKDPWQRVYRFVGEPVDPVVPGIPFGLVLHEDHEDPH
jgi:hypothetical protein